MESGKSLRWFTLLFVLHQAELYWPIGPFISQELKLIKPILADGCGNSHYKSAQADFFDLSGADFLACLKFFSIGADAIKRSYFSSFVALPVRVSLCSD